MENQPKERDFHQELNEELKKLEVCKLLYISDSYAEEINDIDPKILDGVKIPIREGGQECGMVDLGEWISVYLSDIKHAGKPELVFGKHDNPFAQPETIPIFNDSKSGPEEYVKCELEPGMEAKIEAYIKKNIKPSGPSETVVGELFRAFQRIEYRAGNDGDNYFCIGSPSFESTLFILSTMDIINWSWLYEKEIKLETPILKCWTINNQISWDGGLFEIKFIEAIILELLETGVIVDRPNDMDSRSFTPLKLEKDRW